MSSGPSNGWRRVDPRRDRVWAEGCSGKSPERDESIILPGPSGPVRWAIVREEALVRCEPCLDGGRYRPVDKGP